jgi:hypothetical protein
MHSIARRRLLTVQFNPIAKLCNRSFHWTIVKCNNNNPNGFTRDEEEEELVVDESALPSRLSVPLEAYSDYDKPIEIIGSAAKNMSSPSTLHQLRDKDLILETLLTSQIHDWFTLNALLQRLFEDFSAFLQPSDCNQLIGLLVRQRAKVFSSDSSHSEALLRLFDFMKTRQFLSSLSLDNCYILLRIFHHWKQYLASFEVIEIIQTVHLHEFDVTSCTLAFNVFRRLNYPLESLKLLQWIINYNDNRVKTAQRGHFEFSPIRLPGAAYIYLLRQFSHNSRYRAAFVPFLVDHIRKLYNNTQLFDFTQNYALLCEIFNTLANIGDAERATQLMEDLKHELTLLHKILPIYSEKSPFSTKVSVFLRHRSVAERVEGSSLQQNIDLGTYLLRNVAVSQVILALGRAKNLESSVELFETAKIWGNSSEPGANQAELGPTNKGDSINWVELFYSVLLSAEINRNYALTQQIYSEIQEKSLNLTEAMHSCLIRSAFHAKDYKFVRNLCETHGNISKLADLPSNRSVEALIRAAINNFDINSLALALKRLENSEKSAFYAAFHLLHSKLAQEAQHFGLNQASGIDSWLSASEKGSNWDDFYYVVASYIATADLQRASTALSGFLAQNQRNPLNFAALRCFYAVLRGFDDQVYEIRRELRQIREKRSALALNLIEKIHSLQLEGHLLFISLVNQAEISRKTTNSNCLGPFPLKFVGSRLAQHERKLQTARKVGKLVEIGPEIEKIEVNSWELELHGAKSEEIGAIIGLIGRAIHWQYRFIAVLRENQQSQCTSSQFRQFRAFYNRFPQAKSTEIVVYTAPHYSPERFAAKNSKASADEAQNTDFPTENQQTYHYIEQNRMVKFLDLAEIERQQAKAAQETQYSARTALNEELGLFSYNLAGHNGAFKLPFHEIKKFKYSTNPLKQQLSGDREGEENHNISATVLLAQEDSSSEQIQQHPTA